MVDYHQVMASLMFEDKSGQAELLNIPSIDSDSEDVSDSDQESEWVNKVKQLSSSLSKCWDDFPAASFRKKGQFKRSNFGVPEKKNRELDLEDVYLDFGDCKVPIDSSVRKMAEQDELLKGNVLVPEFHRLHEVPTTELSTNLKKAEKRKQKEKTAGPRWFNMPAPEMTDELRRDIEVIKMRSVLDPKHFYKKNTLKSDMKYFQMGRVIESAADFYSSRIPKKERKKTLVDELIADTEFKKYNKKRYKKIIATSLRTGGKKNTLKKKNK